MRRQRLLLLLFALTLAACRSPTAIPTVTPTGPLFWDDFSDPASGWSTLDDADGWIAYQDGALVIHNEGRGTALVTSPGRTFGDSVIEVEAVWSGGTEDNWMGPVCRMQENNGYAFLISADGYFLLARYLEGEGVSLDGPLPSEIIQAGNVVNQLRAECAGQTLRLWVNDVLLSEKTDAAFAAGEAGLLVDSLDGTPTEVRFDHFVVRRP